MKKTRKKAETKMKNYILKIVLVFCLASLFSCSAKNKIEDKNAISVFANQNLLELDQKLKNTPVIVPKYFKNDSWFGNNLDNQEIENFAFEGTFFQDKITKENKFKKISKISSVFSSYKIGFDKEMLFGPIFNKNKIYFLDGKGNLLAINSLNYQLIWKKTLTKLGDMENFTNSKISYFDNKVFAVSGRNKVFCLNADSGKIIWQKTLASLPISVPVASQNQVFLITDNNKTYALNSANGEINWIHSGIVKPTKILGASNPVFYKDYIISSYSSGEIYALNQKTGKEIWNNDLNFSKIINSDLALNDINATPIIKNNIIFAVGNGGLMLAISILDGKILWQKQLASITDFWVAGDFVYLINNDNQVICLGKETGGIKWLYQMKKYLNPKDLSSQIIYNGIVMAGNNLIMINNKQLIVASPFDGKILQTKELNQPVFHKPIVVGGKIYLQTTSRFSSHLLLVE